MQLHIWSRSPFPPCILSSITDYIFISHGHTEGSIQSKNIVSVYDERKIFSFSFQGGHKVVSVMLS